MIDVLNPLSPPQRLKLLKCFHVLSGDAAILELLQLGGVIPNLVSRIGQADERFITVLNFCIQS